MGTLTHDAADDETTMQYGTTHLRTVDKELSRYNLLHFSATSTYEKDIYINILIPGR